MSQKDTASAFSLIFDMDQRGGRLTFIPFEKHRKVIQNHQQETPFQLA